MVNAGRSSETVVSEESWDAIWSVCVGGVLVLYLVWFLWVRLVWVGGLWVKVWHLFVRVVVGWLVGGEGYDCVPM